ncbi:MAG: ATP synthase F1 subunit delta [Ruminococcus sp.]|nr:ATP synthase F1 subunit delta [Ruminococcus sp.]
MAETLEMVYASALFELCIENGSLSEIFDEMSQVKNIFSENEEYLKLLSSPLISEEDKHEVLEKTFGGKLDDMFFDFLCVICDKGRIGFFSGIFSEFKELYNKHMNILEVTVVTSQPMSDKIKGKLIDKLSGSSGKKILLDERVDKSLLGGIILRYDNTEIDSSVKGKLDQLKKQIDSIIA